MMLLEVSYYANSLYQCFLKMHMRFFLCLEGKCVGVKYAVLDIAILEDNPLCPL